MIVDSGNRREFNTGAVRDIVEGKGRCDLLPLDGEYWHLLEALLVFLDFSDCPFDNLADAILEVAKHFEEGCDKYGERNWEKGIPVRCYVDSAIRHYLKWLRGDNDESHHRAFVWNILCCVWTCINKPELNDYAKDGEGE
jgi:hypothetical protein